MTIKNAAMVFVAAILLFGCASDFTSPTSPAGTTLSDVAADNDSLKAFSTALTKAGLYANFDNINGGQYTLFAPTNYSFVKYLRSSAGGSNKIGGVTAATAGDSAIKYINKLTTTSALTVSGLATRLNYHIVSTALPTSQITYGQGFITWNGARLSVSKVTGGAYNFILNAGVAGNGANIIDSDKTGANGVIHVIDNVMTPISTSNIWGGSALNFSVTYGAAVTVAIGGVTVPMTSGAYDVSNAAVNTTDGDNNLFTMALVRSGLATTIIPNATPLPDFTVFAPNDAAMKVYMGNSVDEATARALINGMTPEDLAAMVKYHIVSARLTSYDLIAAQSIPTLLTGKSISVDGSLNVNTSTAFTKKDVLSNAGIFYMVNAVLQPN